MSYCDGNVKDAIEHIHEASKLDFIAEASLKGENIDFISYIYSSMENLQNSKFSGEELEKEKQSEVDALIYLLAVSPSLPDIEKMCQDLLHLCKEAGINRMLLYLAFTARTDPTGLCMFAEKDKAFWSDDESFCQGLVEINRHPLLELLLFSLKKEHHWFPYILDVISRLLEKNCVDTVEKFLSHPYFLYLWPVVLLHLIYKQSPINALKVPVKHCLILNGVDSSLKRLAKCLDEQLTVLSSLEQKGVLVQVTNKFYIQNQGILSLLHNSCNLLDIGWETTHEILLHSLHNGGLANEQELATNSAFWACLLSLKAVLASYQSSAKNSSEYQDKILNNIAKVKIILCQLEPLDLRIQILEKIYSLLFLRFEDFQRETHSDSDDGEEETNTTSMQENTENISIPAAFEPSLSSLTSLGENNATIAKNIDVPSAPSSDVSFAKDNAASSFPVHLQQGFVCERHVARDLLKMLQYCLRKVKDSLPEHHALESFDDDTFDRSSLPLRVERLSGFVSEALLKLEILTSPSFINSEGREYYHGERSSMPVFRNSFSWYFRDEDIRSDEECACGQITHSHGKSDFEKRFESISESIAPCTTHGVSRRTNHPLRRKSTTKFQNKSVKDPIIRKMLSPDTSLVAFCLTRGDFDTANQFKQKLKEGGESLPMYVELTFADAFHNLQLKLNSCAEEWNKNKELGYNSTLKAIQRAASAGVQASSLNNEVEMLLTTFTLPSIPNVQQLPTDFLQLLGGPLSELPFAISGADAALMLSTSAQQALNFLSIASKYSQELRNVQVSGSHRPPSLGFLSLVQSIFQAISLVDSGSPSTLLHRWDVPSLTHRCLKESLQFTEAMKKQIAELDSSQNFAMVYPKFLQLIALFSSVKGIVNKTDLCYMQEFKTYLRTLLQILNKKSAVLTADGPLLEDHFALLMESPYKLLSSMVFEGSILPQDLEVIVSQFGLSLVPILCTELCSSLSSTPPSKRPVLMNVNRGFWSVLILNTSEVVGPARCPTDAVYGLLNSAIIELQHQYNIEQQINSSLNGCLCLSSMDIEKMLLVFSGTWELKAINMNLLKPGAETLVFYCNLATLMWIHALVYLQSINDQNVHAFYRGSRFHQTAVLNSLAYNVGQLGTITFWEARRLALSGDLMDAVGTEALCRHAISSDSYDPFALFIIPSGSKYSPKVQVLKVENLELQLQNAVLEYLNSWVSVSCNEIFVSGLILQYIHHTKQNVWKFLLDSFPQSLHHSLQDQLESLSDDAIITVYDDQNMEESIRIHYYRPAVNMFTKSSEENSPSKPILALEMELMNYLKQKCPLAGVLIQNLLDKTSNTERESEDDLEEALELEETTLQIGFLSLDRLCKTLEATVLPSIFNDSALLCALHNIVPMEILWQSLNLLEQESNWQAIIEILDVLPEVQFYSDHTLSVVYDLSLMELSIGSRGLGEPWKFCERISCLFLRARHTCGEVFFWPGEICLAQLQSLLQTPQLSDFSVLHGKVAQLKHFISVYQEIFSLGASSYWTSWQEVRELSHKNPHAVMNYILCHGSAELCLSWIRLHNILSSYPHLIDERLIALLLNADSSVLHELEEMLHLLSDEMSSGLCLKALSSVHSIPGLQFCVYFLTDAGTESLSLEEKDSIKLVSLGLEMVQLLPEAEQHEYLELVCKPHLILEQLVMNMRLEAAEQILNKIRPELENIGSQSPLAVPAIDAMFRQYAEKALEIRIAQGSSTTSHMTESSLLTSVSSLSSSKDFLMPLNPPSRSDWIPNEQASVCMHCQVTTFSMFSRRHHCRRCGRVVCRQCSSQRMNVDGYGTFKVRVCISCHSQTQLLIDTKMYPQSDQSTTAPSNQSIILAENVWCLSLSTLLNDTVRGEFGYDNTPNISLCLSILNLHSRSAACLNFLVDSAETILSYLQPQGGIPNPEIDYCLVIEICRSLVVAAKVKCAQWGYVSYEPNCDLRLSKIDLISLLISHGCTALIPSETSSHLLRKLQAQLLEEELWELALEVSTKGGMERIIVWSAWGKGCLRAGRWEDAREKFVHCFPSKRSSTDPPLLLEILQILESSQYSVDKHELQKGEPQRLADGRLVPSLAISVFQSLASLKDISQGKFPKAGGTKGHLEPLVYAECCYYLHKYGSHSSYLRFLVRHGDLKEALLHVLGHHLEPQLCFEWVYFPCLKMGQITPLHNAMTSVDPSLCLWKPYLHGICAILERRSLFHTLYEVQQWSKDHVRAAMTCIHFYHQNARSYSDLYLNIKYLMRAQSHLEAAHAVSSVQGKVTKSGSGSSSASSAETQESETLWLQLSLKELDHHLSTVWRQIELTKFLRNSEIEGRGFDRLRRWLPHSFAVPLDRGLPILFGNTSERKVLAGLCILCGKNVEEGFGIAYRIIEGFNLSAAEVYEDVAITLYQARRFSDIQQLVECIRSSGIMDSSKVCDNVLYACITHPSEKPDSSHLDAIIRNITDPVMKISAFIISGQLKSAYLLAVKHQRLNDIERILGEADRLGQTAIKAICLKRLGDLIVQVIWSLPKVHIESAKRSISLQSAFPSWSAQNHEVYEIA